MKLKDQLDGFKKIIEHWLECPCLIPGDCLTCAEIIDTVETIDIDIHALKSLIHLFKFPTS